MAENHRGFYNGDGNGWLRHMASRHGIELTQKFDFAAIDRLTRDRSFDDLLELLDEESRGHIPSNDELKRMATVLVSSLIEKGFTCSQIRIALLYQGEDLYFKPFIKKLSDILLPRVNKADGEHFIEELEVEKEVDYV